MKRVLLSLIAIFSIFFVNVSCDSKTDVGEISQIKVTKVTEIIVGKNNVTTIYKINKDNSRGYEIEAYLTVPDNPKHPYIVVNPIKTGELAICEKKSKDVLNRLKRGNELCERTGAIGLFPIIPEISNSLRHLELDPESILYDDEYNHMERQVAAIIKDAILYTQKKISSKIENRVDMYGYSGEADFATRFAIFYPELLHTVCAGGTSWTPVLPVSTLYGETLNYPLGIADIEKYSEKPFNLDAWKKINFYIDMGLLDNRGCYNRNRLMELKKFRTEEAVFNNSLYKEIWNDFSDVYIQTSERAQMVSYEFQGHAPSFSDYATFLMSNTGSNFVPLTDFSSKASYKTAKGNGTGGYLPNLFVLIDEEDMFTDGKGFGRGYYVITLTVYADGKPTEDFTFTQTKPEYGTITKDGATLTLHATELNNVGSRIRITTNDSKYSMELRWHD